MKSPVPSLELDTSPITNRLPQISSPAFPPAPIPNRSSPNRLHGSASISTSSTAGIAPLPDFSEGREGVTPSLFPPLAGGDGILTRTLQFFGMLPEGVDCDSGIHSVLEYVRRQEERRNMVWIGHAMNAEVGAVRFGAEKNGAWSKVVVQYTTHHSRYLLYNWVAYIVRVCPRI